MGPYDPVERIQEEVTAGEAKEALALCLRFFAATNEQEFITIFNEILARLGREPQLIDPLEFLYYTLAERSQAKIILLNAATEWAKKRDPQARAVDIEPLNWLVTVKTDNGYEEVLAKREAPENDARIVMIMTAEEEWVSVYPDWDYHKWVDNKGG
ncbi:MAG: hypothetical protein L0322_30055 [Chloroflexi bacterium]|nr:hypothetical protein [Chloroflexota bacterium]MCI0644343.1 hypothetical protein [Chloroflexota bacterium]